MQLSIWYIYFQYYAYLFGVWARKLHTRVRMQPCKIYISVRKIYLPKTPLGCMYYTEKWLNHKIYCVCAFIHTWSSIYYLYTKSNHRIGHENIAPLGRFPVLFLIVCDTHTLTRTQTYIHTHKGVIYVFFVDMCLPHTA